MNHQYVTIILFIEVELIYSLLQFTMCEFQVYTRVIQLYIYQYM